MLSKLHEKAAHTVETFNEKFTVLATFSLSAK